MKRFGALLVVFSMSALTACGHSALPQTAAPAPYSALRHLGPQDSASSLPGDSASSLPGDSASSLPGDSASSLPGAQLSCGLQSTPGAMSCTIAIDLNVAPNSVASTPASILPGLHPADVQAAYALPSQNPGGTVAIVDAFDDPAAESDLAVYRSAFGLPPCTSANGCLTKVDERGGTTYPATDLAWNEETMLDLDTVSAACPNCKILLVEANSTSIDDLGAAVNTAAKMGAVAISNSYYTTEWSGEGSYDAYYAHPGIAITVAAGDSALPFYPATSPNVTAVGATSLTGSAGAWSESPWAYTGQGCSAYETKPDWQGSNRCQGKRSTTDVAVVGDPQTGVSMYDSTAGGWLVAGGTSVGAPLVAAAYALSGNPQGPAYSYAHASAFDDIAPAGYDYATGLGSPKGVSGF